MCSGWHYGLAVACLGFLGAFPGPATAQGEGSSAPVEIFFSLEGPNSLPVKGSLVLRPADGHGEAMKLAVTSLAAVSLSLPVGSKWEVSADLPGFWVRRQSLAIGSPDQRRLTLAVWPLGTISGLVKVKGNKGVLPRHLIVRSLIAPAFAKRPSAPKGALDCPVDAKGAWSCSLPAATYDLVISAQGLTPHYRWGVRIPAGQKVSLGSVELEAGASVSGWVAVEEGAVEPGRCVARLAPLVASGGNLDSASDLDRTAVSRTVRRDGFFQLTGLSPGMYSLSVQQPGYAPIRLAPVRVDPGAETFLGDPLVLKRPIETQYEIRPPLDWLGRPWSAQVFEIGERRPSPKVFEGKADDEGRFTVSARLSLRYRVDVKDSLGNRLYSGEHSANEPASAPAVIDIRLVTVTGRIRLGGEPLSASLWFGGSFGETSVKMESDSAGKFHGVLPREGLWRVEVVCTEPRLSTWTRVEIGADRSGRASFEIELPNTTLSGRVVDESGKPAPSADVIVRGASVDFIATADAEGNFTVRCLPEGPVWLGAEHGLQMSDLVLLTLTENQTVGPIELRLRSNKRVTGTVTSSRGPVAGSRVVLLSRTPGGGGAATTTETDGAFHANLPQPVSRVEAIVSAPGYALQAFETLTGEVSLVLQVSEAAGTLEITPPFAGDDLARHDLVLAAFQNGLPIPVAVLSQWAREQGRGMEGTERALRVPNVAPGQYRVCLIPRQLELSLPWGVLPQETPCDSGLLAPGASLSLKPPRPG